jgi:hypothetical protein
MDRRTTERWLSELRGPRAWTEFEARRVIEAWQESGESVAAFARDSGLAAQRVYWWRGRLGAVPAGTVAHEEQVTLMPTFVPVTLRATSSSTAAAVTVCTRDGLRVEVAELDGTSAAWVATLVRSLGEGAS